LALCADRLHAASNDVVLHAADAVTIQGNWAVVTEPSAAGGRMLSSADRGWGPPASALPAPADFVEFTFSAPADTVHHVWLRLRATQHSKWNDSVFVQFSDAVSADGTPIYRIGSSSALTVNLQPCDGCAFSGWGWLDGAYWLTQSSSLRFSAGGTHSIRVQTREDGVQLDQVVISSAAYLSTPPGSRTNDTTIVQKASSTPFLGAPYAVPGTIPTANYDEGGQGLAYHDLTAGNAGGQHRGGDVDLAASSEGGFTVGWTDPGEWLAYTVDVSAAGLYLLEARVASYGSGGRFHVEFGGVDRSGPLTIPNTGGWQSWRTISAPVRLQAGVQRMRIVLDASGLNAVGNLAWVRLTPRMSSPFTPGGVTLPGSFSAADFDEGGEGVAYHDLSLSNSGGQYRSTAVDIERCSLGGYNVGWIGDGEWLTYTVQAATAGEYRFDIQVASPLSTGRLHLVTAVHDGPVVAVPATGGWQKWSAITVTASLAAGTQAITFVFDGGGFNLAGVTATYLPPVVPESQTVIIGTGGNLQQAIDLALPGDTILLEAGATFVGNFTLPAKSGDRFITIRSAAPDTSLPPEGVRIDPSYAGLLAKIRSPNSKPAIKTAPGAHHYRLLFLEFSANVNGAGDIVALGDGSAAQNSLALVPHHLVVDRVYVHGDPVYGQKRAIALNSADTSIVNSYIDDIKAVGQDSQALGGWNGPGPFIIANNFLEAAGENLMFGGTDPSIPGLVPGDITITRNHLSKRLAWRGTSWTVKNLLELKNAERVVIDGNVLEFNWQAGQAGYAVVFTPRNPGGTAPWSIVQQVRFTNNVVRRVAAGINILGTDDNHVSRQATDILIRNNLFEDVSRAVYGGHGHLMLINGGTNVTVDHNTVMQDGATVLYGAGAQAQGFVFTNNIIPDYAYAIMGSAASPGNGTIAQYFPGGLFLGNIIAGANPLRYPGGNSYPSALTDVGFVDLNGKNYRLSSSSLGKNAATDGTDIGTDIDALDLAAGTAY
jgi:hypothetical protein